MAVYGLRWQVIAVVTLLIASLAVPVAAHGNYLAADAQVSADGIVRIEAVTLITTGYVVLHADDAGEIGEVIGHVKPAENVFHGNLSVPMNESYWATVTGHTTIWAVLHHDADNDEEFDPAQDPPIGGSDDPDHAIQLTVGKGERPAYVLAEAEHSQKTNVSEVVIRRVHLPEDGYLVIQTDVNGSPGDIIGQTALAAGSQENVSVSLDEHAYHHQPEQFPLWAVIYVGDGSGEFDDGDVLVTADGSSVASRFVVERTGDLDAGHEHTATPTVTAVVTASPTPTEHDHDHEHGEESETASQSSTPIDTPVTTDGQPGFGLVEVLLVFVMIVVGCRWKSA